jgi:hypothetical protein
MYQKIKRSKDVSKDRAYSCLFQFTALRRRALCHVRLSRRTAFRGSGPYSLNICETITGKVETDDPAVMIRGRMLAPVSTARPSGNTADASTSPASPTTPERAEAESFKTNGLSGARATDVKAEAEGELDIQGQSNLGMEEFMDAYLPAHGTDSLTLCIALQISLHFSGSDVKCCASFCTCCQM